VVGGRWKPLHYWLKSHLFAAAFAACDATGACVVRSDDPLAPLNATLTLTAVSTLTGAPVGALAAPRAVALRRGAGALEWGCLDGAGAPPACAPPAAALARAGCAANGTDCAVLSVLTDAASGAELARNLQLWAVPSALAVARGATVAAAVGAPAPDGSVPVTLTVQGGAALLVLLSSAAQGRWSDNALQLLAPGKHTVALMPMLPPGGGAPPVDAALLESTLRVEHFGAYA
jgi:beta-mannosidase